MADFPTTVFAPATRSNGQTIDASHVNNLQAEVTAIEDGYLNATAPLNSSGSTVATLSVSGGSTFTSRPVMPPPDAVRMTFDADPEIADNSTTALSWTQQTFATNSSLHSTGTNPERITPQSTGVYMCQAGIAWNTLTSTDYYIRIEDSSGTIIGASRDQGAQGRRAQTISALKRFDSVSGSTQWIRIVVLAVGTTNSIDRQQSYLSLHKL